MSKEVDVPEKIRKKVIEINLRIKSLEKQKEEFRGVIESAVSRISQCENMIRELGEKKIKLRKKK